jgi:hypothetical protein
MEEYLGHFREFSDIQEASPRPLHELELPRPLSLDIRHATGSR